MLIEQGGVWLDTDIECLKPLDELQGFNLYVGRNCHRTDFAEIGVMGAQQDDPTLKEIFEVMQSKDFNAVSNGFGPKFYSGFFSEDNCTILETDCFYPYPGLKDVPERYGKATYCAHHSFASWVSGTEYRNWYNKNIKKVMLKYPELIKRVQAQLKENQMDLTKYNRANIELRVTSVCNFNCNNCTFGKHLGIHDPIFMSIETVKKVINELEELNYNVRVSMSGGEPTLHKDLIEITKLLDKSKSIHTIRLCTNRSNMDKTNEVRANVKNSKFQLLLDDNKNASGSFFHPCQIAPIDLGLYNEEVFRCKAPDICGFEVYPDGTYYPCFAGSTLAKVFKDLNIGVSSLKELTDENITDQCKQMCKYCGAYLACRGQSTLPDNPYFGFKTRKQLFTESWLDAHPPLKNIPHEIIMHIVSKGYRNS